MDSIKSTAHFEIPRLSIEHNGLWECRVSTNGGQDSFKFSLTVKGEIHFTFLLILINSNHFRNRFLLVMFFLAEDA